MMSSRSIHVPANGNISFLLWLSSIPLRIYVPSFVRPSADGHTGRPPHAIVVNKSAGNPGGACTFTNSCFLLDIYPGGGIVGSLGSSTFSF